MARGSQAEKIFGQNLDRLISGLEVGNLPETDLDLKSALDFARIMKIRRPQPSPRFQSELKARLMQKLAQQETEVQPTWFEKLMPRQLLWRAVTILAVLLVAGGIFTGILLRNNGSAPIVQAPTTTDSDINDNCRDDHYRGNNYRIYHGCYFHYNCHYHGSASHHRGPDYHRHHYVRFNHRRGQYGQIKLRSG